MEVKILYGKIINVKLGTKRALLDETSTNWEEPGEGRVKQILITYGMDAINSIQMVYEQNEKLKLAPRHGGDGDNFYSVNSSNYTVIRSLRLDTNLGSFGPVGCAEGTPFSFDIPSSSSFYGFHGCSNSMYLTAIGVYLDVSDLKRFQYPPEPRVGAPPPK
ncbi:inactive protein RESTRICTED TEV MOVEMENT 1-like [Curcuma longa]|uniref:inactive protein RESTRICTED TEV MOVEMENT 1-like n=1 Tax=Curcuma longa TaxID=136217 RepID=UPI003D9DD670